MRRIFGYLWLASFLAWIAPPAMEAADVPHWAYAPLRSVIPPSGLSASEARNPVDAFLLKAMHAELLEPGPEADRRTWLRRVSFDLTGLPPTPDELRAFEQDLSPAAYERVVDRLLASPRYGERWARHWMDVAHFAETHGHDQDRIRTNAWPYRDYLINSLNADKSYARWVQEQVAGDVLFPEDPWATVALGFIAAGPWDESSLRDIREDTLDRQIGRYLDRDDMVATVMTAVASTTVHCARCHDHKFDPIPQADYYALQAVFAGVDRANRSWDHDPQVHVRRQELRGLLRRVQQGDVTLLRSEETQREVGAWESQMSASPGKWVVPHDIVSTSESGVTLVRQTDGSLLADGPRPERDTYKLTTHLPLRTVTAVRLEVLPDSSLPQKGPGRADNGNFHLSEVQLLVLEPGITQPQEVRLVHPTADFNQADWTIAQALDQNEKTAWGIHPQEGAAHQAVFELATSLTVTESSQLVLLLKQLHGGGHVIGRFRCAFTDQPQPIGALPAELATILEVPSIARTDEQSCRLATHVLTQRIQTELAALPPPSLVYAAASDFEPDGGLKPTNGPREVRRLRRGEITKPLEVASPGALTCLSELTPRFNLAHPSDEGSRRAALAHWLTEPENPLTWRSIVNRVWQLHFGRGIVDTPNDFGHLGTQPSHPELLDWLAIWFRDDAHGSLKALHRLLVTSAAYRRASTLGPQFTATQDPENRLCSRMNRTRLDAECIRDAILQWSGQLDLRMGGPSDQQFDLQPGIHVTPRVDYGKFAWDSEAGLRRGVYRFLFRTLPDPFMEALDCPAGDQLVSMRNNSVTVQQALALWNHTLVAQQAEHLADRLRATSGDEAKQIDQACELIWGRPPGSDEMPDLTAYVNHHGLANLCRLLLNSNEFVFLN